MKRIQYNSPRIVLSVLAIFALLSIGLFTLDHLRRRAQSTQVIPTDPYAGVLPVRMSDGWGSCFVVAQRDNYWYAITARHVAPRIGADLAVDEEFYSAEVVRVSGSEDIALIRFQSPETYPIYTFAETQVGADCVTVGWSRGSRLLYKGSIVSLNLNSFIAANGGVLPGCSGGALFDPSGQVVGVTVAVSMYYQSAFDSTALYVPARFARAMIVTIP